MAEARIRKAEETEEQRIVYAEVYAPNRPDVHGEFMTAEDIREMAHGFLASKRVDQVDTQHDNKVTSGVTVVESFIARDDDPDFIAGSWVVGVHVDDDDLWEKVKKGELNSFSVEALVIKEEVEVEIEIPEKVTGTTTEADGHSHTFEVAYDDQGNLKGGRTNVVDGHMHVIKTGTVTEISKGHRHKFSAVDDISIVDEDGEPL